MSASSTDWAKLAPVKTFSVHQGHSNDLKNLRLMGLWDLIKSTCTAAVFPSTENVNLHITKRGNENIYSKIGY